MLLDPSGHTSGRLHMHPVTGTESTRESPNGLKMYTSQVAINGHLHFFRVAM